jgi:hypothetical protein
VAPGPVVDIQCTITDIEYRVTLPEGWTAQLPAPVTVTSFFAGDESRYDMEGRTVVMHRVVEGIDSDVQAPERVAEVAACLRAVAADDHEFLTLTPAP